jgi:autotransporter translocation and assembly factor TamB
LKLARARLRTWLGRIAKVILSLGVCLALALWLTLGTTSGRARLLAWGLPKLNSVIPGQLRVAELAKLSPFGVELSALSLDDPARQRVVELVHVRLEFSPLQLLRGRIVIRSLELGPGQIDLSQVGVEGRGPIGALIRPSPAPAAPDGAAPPYIRVESLRVHGLTLRAPELAPMGLLEIRDLEVLARVEVDQTPVVALKSLSFELFRNQTHVGHVGSPGAGLERPGENSWIKLQADLGALHVALDALGVLSPSPAAATAPLRARLDINGLRAEQLADWLAQPDLARAFTGELGLELTASGNLDDLSLQATLHSDAGAVALRLHALGRRQLELELQATGLVLAQLRPELPTAPLTLRLEGSADVGVRSRIPVRLRLHAAQFGKLELPELTGEAVWQAGHLTQLRSQATLGESSVQVEGDVDLQGPVELRARVDVRETELAALARALDGPAHSGGRVSADVRVSRNLAGELGLVGSVSVRQLSVPGLALERGDINLDLAGAPLELAGTLQARLRGLEAGDAKVRAVEVSLAGGPRNCRIRADVSLARLHAALDVRVTRDSQQAVVHGGATGEFDGTPFSLELARTRLELAGVLDTAGISVRSGAQSLRAVGTMGRPNSELVVTGHALDLARLSALLGLAPALSGHAELEARLSGSVASPRVKLSLEARQLSRSGQGQLDASVKANLDGGAGKFELAAHVASTPAAGPNLVEAQLASSSAFVGGAGWMTRLTSAQNKLTLQVRHLDLALLGPWSGQTLPASGQVSLEARLEGAWTDPALHVELRGEIKPVGNPRSLQFEHSFDYADSQLRTALTLNDALGRWLDLGAELTLPGDAARDLKALLVEAPRLPDAAAWNLHLGVARRSLAKLAVFPVPDQARVDLEGTLEASHTAGTEPQAHARFRLIQNAAPSAVAGCSDAGLQLELDTRLAEGQLKAVLIGMRDRQELLRATSNVQIALTPALRGAAPEFGAVASQISSRKLDLQNLPFLCQRLRGKLDATVDVVDLLGESPALRANISASGFSLGAEPALDVLLRGRADRDDASLELGISAPQGQAQVRAALPIDWSRAHFKLASGARLDANAVFRNLPIAALLDPGGAVSHAAGRLSGEVSVQGPIESPEPSGHLELEDGELTATALAQSLQKVRGRFEFKDKVLKITHFEAHDRDGLLQIDGRVNLHDPRQIDASLSVVVKDFPLRQQGQVVATTSAHAKIDAKISDALTEVSLVLKEADTWLEKTQARSGIRLQAHPDFAIQSADGGTSDPTHALAASGGTPGPGQDEVAQTTTLKLDATDHFWVKRDDFAIQLSTSLVVHIAAGRTLVKGRVDIHRGYLDLMGRVFDIDRGSHLEFIGSSVADPVVAIEARHERRSTGKTIKVKISGRGSHPELTFLIDDAEVSAGLALEALMDNGQHGSEASAKNDATSFVSGLTAGLLATSARRELGAAAPIIMIEPGEHAGDGRIRAGFELDALVPDVLAKLITGVYLEGIVTKEGSTNPQNSTQAGVLVELYFPYQLFSTGQWGPGTTWSIDWGWQL